MQRLMQHGQLSKWLVVVGAVVLATLCGRLIDVRHVAGDIKGDEATYIAMASSLANDGDLRWRPEDYRRFKAVYERGPSGIFLKRSYHFSLHNPSPVPADESLSFGKALIYPAAAAPFVVVGGLGGMLIFNGLLLAGCIWCGALFAAAVTGRLTGWLLAFAFVMASVVPVFGAWLTSEVFNFSLVFFAYFLWLYKKVASAEPRRWLTSPATTLIAALLIGLAAFSKGTNAALIAPLVVDALIGRRIREGLLVAVVFVASTAGLFGLNALITGEANYQGAQQTTDRRSFYDAYPFDEQGTRFDTTGHAMVTNDADTGRVLASDALEQVPINVLYFFVGRHAGLIPFYFPGVVIAAGWLLHPRRVRVWQVATALAVAGSVAALIVFFPDSWNGGGGPPGNRYFLSLYPPLLFLAWTGIGLPTAVLALAGGVAFTGAMVLHPFAASAATWKNVERAPLRWLPIEITLLNDLPVRLNQLRGPILFVREPTVLLYYMDGHTYSAEGDGLWIAGQATAEIVVRTEHVLKRMDIIFSAPIENTVEGRLDGRPFSVTLKAGQESRVQIGSLEGERYHQSYAYVLHMTTSNGFVPAEREPGSKDTRNLGVFVRPRFVYEDEPR
ncbi:MAG: hypothetical protein ABI051_08395 [Vicinamibacterales bacterium]